VPGIVIFTRLHAAPGHAEQVMAAFEALHERAADEPGTLAFAIHVAADDPNVLLGYEVYADDDALAAHRDSDAVRDAVRTFGELLDGPSEVTYARLVRGKGVPLA
jgi:quinol monooxygenase YgiN